MTTPDVATAGRTGRTCILAGSGSLPHTLAAELAASGRVPYVIALTDDCGPWIAGFDHVRIPVAKLAAIIASMRAANCTRAVLAGGLNQRPRLFDFRLDWRTFTLIPRLFKALGKGDDGLLRAAVLWLEEQGMEVVGAHDICPALLSPAGVLTLLKPGDADILDAEAAKAAALELGRADIGQAAVARERAVIAREDRRGTKAMLNDLSVNQTGLGRSGVLAKFAKPGQESRVDLPTIGPETVDQCAAAGLAGIAVESGRSLMLEQEKTIGRANELGLFILGMPT